MQAIAFQHKRCAFANLQMINQITKKYKYIIYLPKFFGVPVYAVTSVARLVTVVG